MKPLSLIALLLLALASACGATTECSARSCPLGCCDSSGSCQSGSTDAACGDQGRVCGQCLLGQTCLLKSCSAIGGATGGGSAAGGGSATGGGVGTGGGGCSNCGVGRACHPVLQRCEPTCSGASDCLSAAKTCAAIGNSSSNFCQCSTDALCNAAVPGEVCGVTTRTCAARCRSTSDCPSALLCNTVTGQCGVGPQCHSNNDCALGNYCDDSGQCTSSRVCDSASAQPGPCGYGHACNAVSLCQAVVDGTCSNVVGRTAWTTSSFGPVIFNVVDEPIDDTSSCVGSATPFTVSVFAYAGSSPSTFPSQKANLPGFLFYSSTGATIDISAVVLRQSDYTLYFGGTVMGAKFTLCGPAGATQLSAGFGFTGGNGACAILNH